MQGSRLLPELQGNINDVTKHRTVPANVPKSAEFSVASLGELCLHHLAEQPEQLAAFMGETGWSPATLRGAVGSEALAAGLIDYFAQNEPLLLALCANANMRPEDFMRVWGRLNAVD